MTPHMRGLVMYSWVCTSILLRRVIAQASVKVLYLIVFDAALTPQAFFATRKHAPHVLHVLLSSHIGCGAHLCFILKYCMPSTLTDTHSSYGYMGSEVAKQRSMRNMSARCIEYVAVSGERRCGRLT
ncbi:hypothetical protein PLICRDRAFT_447270 [Plicaturopsis crispa FD-325 SS-3]|uniref:Uncharacterized protein n=1 Tax=Plicaturopsis crispa FD-325 SS-3 TaxID=944288 RepID=A0A0C9SKF4_PLICR|nr:hypothetical protein PLICRDRAFT_447270 [Plicaturopsis crispa FD-325 SS-3]